MRKLIFGLALAAGSLGLPALAAADQDGGWRATQLADWDGKDWCRAHWQEGMKGAFDKKNKDEWQWCLRNKSGWQPSQSSSASPGPRRCTSTTRTAPWLSFSRIKT